MKYDPVWISPTFKRLLKYLVKYRKLRGKASEKLLIEQLILAYAKQLISGMPEPVWRANMLTLINECDKQHQEEYRHEMDKYKATQRRASQSLGDEKKQTLLRRSAQRKVYKGKNKKTL